MQDAVGECVVLCAISTPEARQERWDSSRNRIRSSVDMKKKNMRGSRRNNQSIENTHNYHVIINHIPVELHLHR